MRTQMTERHITGCAPPNSRVMYVVGGNRNNVTAEGGWGTMIMTVGGEGNIVSVRDYNLELSGNHPDSLTRNTVTRLDSESNGPDEFCRAVNVQCSLEEEYWTDVLLEAMPRATDPYEPNGGLFGYPVQTNSPITPGFLSSPNSPIAQDAHYDVRIALDRLRYYLGTVLRRYIYGIYPARGLGLGSRPLLPNRATGPTSQPTTRTLSPTEGVEVAQLRPTFCSEWTSGCRDCMNTSYCQDASMCEHVAPSFTSEQLVRNYCMTANARCFQRFNFTDVNVFNSSLGDSS